MVDNNIDIQISPDALSIDRCYDFVLNEKCGGIDLFVGTVRRWNKGEEVTHLFFESYVEMAKKEMAKIAKAAIENFNLEKISIHHRVGKVELEGIAVIIAVSSKHRKAAFEACEYAIDTLKDDVPIWKKEFLKDGSYWVNSRP